MLIIQVAVEKVIRIDASIDVRIHFFLILALFRYWSKVSLWREYSFVLVNPNDFDCHSKSYLQVDIFVHFLVLVFTFAFWFVTIIN